MKRTESNQYLGPLVIVAVLGVVVASGFFLTTAAYLGTAAAGGEPLSANPIAVVLEVVTGTLPWTVAMTAMLVALIGAFVGLPVAGLVWRSVHVRRRVGKRSRVDYAARHMGKGGSIEPLTRAAVAKKAAQLGAPTNPPGLFIGRAVVGGRDLFASWEDMWLIVAGPRSGKTTSVAIGTIAAAPGAVVVTSNKPDIVTSTRAVRAREGRVWVFNPQEVTTDTASWWWNPLSSVTDDVSAEKLARHFADGAARPGAHEDAFFHGSAVELLKSLILAAALGGRPITAIAEWLSDADDKEPLTILETTNRYPLITGLLANHIAAPDKQRAGVYATAQQMSACLTNSAIAAWVCRQDDRDHRPEFDHRAFVTSTDTLYSLSREGAGSAGPLVLALTASVIEHAVRFAANQPTGRLAVPMVTVLDEAANVCRWKDLPDLYSHLGSHGVLGLTILQSWSQGVDVWNESGMKKLWSAANIKIYLGAVGEAPFLRDLSDVIGDRELNTASVSTGKGRSVSHQRQRDRILDVSELQALPPGRAIVLASKAPPVLARMVPWWEGPYAAAIKDESLITPSIPVEAPRPVLAIEAPRTTPALVAPAQPGESAHRSWATSPQAPTPPIQDGAASQRRSWSTPAPAATSTHSSWSAGDAQ